MAACRETQVRVRASSPDSRPRRRRAAVIRQAPLVGEGVSRGYSVAHLVSPVTRSSNLTLPTEIDVLVQAVYEDQVDVPESLRERLGKALMVGEGEAITQRRAKQTRRSLACPTTHPGMIHRDSSFTTRMNPVSIEPSWPRPGLAKTPLSLSRYGGKTASARN